MRPQQESKPFFSEEKKQKTFSVWSSPTIGVHHQEQKFFGSFFQKRTSFFLCCP
jgi:hypothetical protein